MHRSYFDVGNRKRRLAYTIIALFLCTFPQTTHASLKDRVTERVSSLYTTITPTIGETEKHASPQHSYLLAAVAASFPQLITRTAILTNHEANTTATSLWCIGKALFGNPCAPRETTDIPDTTARQPEAEPEPAVPALIPTPAPTSPPAPPTIVNQYFTTTNPTSIIRETVRDGGGAGADTSSFVTRSLFDAQVDAFYNSLTSGTDGLAESVSTAVSTAVLTVSGSTELAALTASGATTLQGTLTLSALQGGILTTNASGVVSTTTVSAASIAADTLNFTEFSDSLIVDASTTFDLDTNSATSTLTQIHSS